MRHFLATAILLATSSCGVSLSTWANDLAKASCRYQLQCSALAFNGTYSSIDDCVAEQGEATADNLATLNDARDDCAFVNDEADKCLAAYATATGSCEPRDAEDVIDDCLEVLECGGQPAGNGASVGNIPSGGGGGGGGAAPDASTFGSDYAAALCGFAESCDFGGGLSTDACIEQTRTAYNQSVKSLRDTCDFDEKAATDCLDAISSAVGDCSPSAFSDPKLLQRCSTGVWDCEGNGGGGGGGDTADW